ncbi:MAG TPA: nucleotide exchange factor GrpE [Pyrinomonadaceae bacterium]|jgi:molecular chaperone GrpE
MNKRDGEEAGPRGGEEAAREEGVRVSDRRRVKLDDEGVRVDAEAVEATSTKPKYVEELEARARAAEQKALDVQARFEQVRAQLQRETDETRRRLNRAADDRLAREKASFIASLLPFVDNLRRAIDAAQDGGGVGPLLDGLRGTLSGFEGALAAAGVEPVAAVGAQFDPELHEAVDTVEVEPGRDGEITSEYSRGYRLGDQLVRPARVQVGRSRADAQAAAE